MSLMLQLAGTALAASSIIQEGKAQSAAALANADISKLQAEQTRKAGEYEVSKIERSKKQTAGTQRALYAKSGVLISEGSPIEVMADTATQYEMDIQAQKYNTAISAARYDYESEYQQSMAKRYKQMAKTKAIGTTLLSIGNIIGGQSASPSFGGSSVTPGQGGYGTNTPAGTKNMGTWSKIV